MNLKDAIAIDELYNSLSEEYAKTGSEDVLNWMKTILAEYKKAKKVLTRKARSK